MTSGNFELFLGLVLAFICQGCFGVYLHESPIKPPSFSYEGKTGPEYWCKMPGYQDCCSTKWSRQSPINIDTSNLGRMYDDLNFAGYKTSPVAVDISNNGHTVVLGFQTFKTSIPTIANGPLKASNLYYLDGVHFHWGPDAKSGGAEHTVDNKRYPMEMHMVHYNSLYNSTAQAENYPNGLAVMSVLITVSEYDNPTFSELVNNLKYIRYKGTHRYINSMVLADLLPEDPAPFYTYPGSLTTPPCSETVTWIVFTNAITMSLTQMNQFRKLQEDTKADSTGDNPIKKNFRPLQPMNGRTTSVWYEGYGPVWGK